MKVKQITLGSSTLALAALLTACSSNSTSLPRLKSMVANPNNPTTQQPNNPTTQQPNNPTTQQPN